MNTALAALTALALSLAAVPAIADADRGASPSSYHLDAEVDPTAYALSGYSGHLGLGLDHVRLDLGAYAMRLPQFVHGDDGYDVRFDGFGAKVQYFFSSEGQKGFFAGVDGGFTRVHATRQGTDVTDVQHTVGVGVHAGYRIALPAGFYATPWLGIGYSFGGHDVNADGATFESMNVTVFPAIHLGYRFL